MEQTVHLQLMVYHGGAGFHSAACGEAPSGAGGPAMKEAAACGADSRPELQPMEREQVTWQELPPVGDPCWSSSLLMNGPCGTEPCWSSS